MHTYGIRAAKAPRRRCEHPPHERIHAAVRALAGILAAAAALLGATAIASADPVTFLDKWVGHDRSMQLSSDSTGTLVIGSGAMDTDQWGVTWKQNPSDSITITLASLTARGGQPQGHVGDQYIATIQPNSAAQQLLYMHKVGAQGQVITFCPPGAASACGA